jgi:DNA topoisomerase I
MGQTVSTTEVTPLDPYQAALHAGLRYASPEGTGFRRLKSGKSFKYVDQSGAPVKDKTALLRIKSLVIPPAWTDVWISSEPNTHIQAVGWDAKGRKQYRYHELYREVRDHAKFDRLIEFGRVLPSIRAALRKDLAQPGVPRRKVVATVVQLLEATCIRIGNEEYERMNGSFGLTTLKNRHVVIEGAELRFRFRGKSGQSHDIVMKDRRLARIVKECQCIAGYELFTYLERDGEAGTIRSEDVNDYLLEVTQGHFTAKDFRTWAGTVTAAEYLRTKEKPATATQLKKDLAEAVKHTAQKLGNRPATCRKYYIHPVIFSTFEDGSLLETFQKSEAKGDEPGENSLKAHELAVMTILENAPALIVKKRRRKSSGEKKVVLRRVRAGSVPGIPRAKAATA